jgi:hypothetical protein
MHSPRRAQDRGPIARAERGWFQEHPVFVLDRVDFRLQVAHGGSLAHRTKVLARAGSVSGRIPANFIAPPAGRGSRFCCRASCGIWSRTAELNRGHHRRRAGGSLGHQQAAIRTVVPALHPSRDAITGSGTSLSTRRVQAECRRSRSLHLTPLLHLADSHASLKLPSCFSGIERVGMGLAILSSQSVSLASEHEVAVFALREVGGPARAFRA